MRHNRQHRHNMHSMHNMHNDKQNMHIMHIKIHIRHLIGNLFVYHVMLLQCCDYYAQYALSFWLFCNILRMLLCLLCILCNIYIYVRGTSKYRTAILYVCARKGFSAQAQQYILRHRIFLHRRVILIISIVLFMHRHSVLFIIMFMCVHRRIILEHAILYIECFCTGTVFCSS